MRFTEGSGCFVARQVLTPSVALRLASAGLRRVLLQVDWQRSKLAQRGTEGMRAELRNARAAGLEVWWWAWVEPAGRDASGRRPTGPRALAERLDELVAEFGTPEGFVADCEVGGGWGRSKLDGIVDVAIAARAAGMRRVGLTSHGLITHRWHADAFDLGLPQCYRREPLDARTLTRWLASWAGAGEVWPVLGCGADSPPGAMRADRRALAEVGGRGACWWSSRPLRGEKLAAARWPSVAVAENA